MWGWIIAQAFGVSPSCVGPALPLCAQGVRYCNMKATCGEVAHRSRTGMIEYTKCEPHCKHYPFTDQQVAGRLLDPGVSAMVKQRVSVVLIALAVSVMGMSMSSVAEVSANRGQGLTSVALEAELYRATTPQIQGPANDFRTFLPVVTLSLIHI